jgi:hypothetical protein
MCWNEHISEIDTEADIRAALAVIRSGEESGGYSGESVDVRRAEPTGCAGGSVASRRDSHFHVQLDIRWTFDLRNGHEV